MNRQQTPAKTQQSKRQKTKYGQFRIIAGQWRGRKLQFPLCPDLRPTPDRIRETLFNWLGNSCIDANCLDLCCGSGALGLEALSRGAAQCLFLDSNVQAVEAINQHLRTLNSKLGSAQQCQLPQGLSSMQHKTGFSVIFLDPPYAQSISAECLDALQKNQLIANNAWVYIEVSAKSQLPSLPQTFCLHRHKLAGQVQYALFQYQCQTGS